MPELPAKSTITFEGEFEKTLFYQILELTDELKRNEYSFKRKSRRSSPDDTKVRIKYVLENFQSPVPIISSKKLL